MCINKKIKNVNMKAISIVLIMESEGLQSYLNNSLVNNLKFDRYQFHLFVANSCGGKSYRLKLILLNLEKFFRFSTKNNSGVEEIIIVTDEDSKQSYVDLSEKISQLCSHSFSVYDYKTIENDNSLIYDIKPKSILCFDDLLVSHYLSNKEVILRCINVIAHHKCVNLIICIQSFLGNPLKELVEKCDVIHFNGLNSTSYKSLNYISTYLSSEHHRPILKKSLILFDKYKREDPFVTIYLKNTFNSEINFNVAINLISHLLNNEIKCYTLSRKIQQEFMEIKVDDDRSAHLLINCDSYESNNVISVKDVSLFGSLLEETIRKFDMEHEDDTYVMVKKSVIDFVLQELNIKKKLVNEDEEASDSKREKSISSKEKYMKLEGNLLNYVNICFPPKKIGAARKLALELLKVTHFRFFGLSGRSFYLNNSLETENYTKIVNKIESKGLPIHEIRIKTIDFLSTVTKRDCYFGVKNNKKKKINYLYLLICRVLLESDTPKMMIINRDYLTNNEI